MPGKIVVTLDTPARVSVDGKEAPTSAHVELTVTPGGASAPAPTPRARTSAKKDKRDKQDQKDQKDQADKDYMLDPFAE